MAAGKKTAKKVARKTSAKRKTPRQLEEEIANLGERLKISQFRFASLAAAVESERALSKTVVTAYEELKLMHALLNDEYRNLARVHGTTLDELDDNRNATSRLEGKVEGMMSAYQHSLETVTDNLATNMVIQGEMSSMIPPEG